MTELTTDPVCSQSALPLAGAPARQLMAPWGYPPTRAPLATIRTAGHAGDLSAQFTLGWIYEHGADVPQDYREAIDWYRRAASQGEPEAINTVGLALLLRQGRPERSARGHDLVSPGGGARPSRGAMEPGRDVLPWRRRAAR